MKKICTVFMVGVLCAVSANAATTGEKIVGGLLLGPLALAVAPAAIGTAAVTAPAALGAATTTAGTALVTGTTTAAMTAPVVAATGATTAGAALATGATTAGAALATGATAVGAGIAAGTTTAGAALATGTTLVASTPPTVVKATEDGMLDRRAINDSNGGEATPGYRPNDVNSYGRYGDYDDISESAYVEQKQSCRQQRAGMSEEAKACCDAGRASSWDKVVPGKCICIVVGSNPKVADPDKEFQIVNGRGRCVTKETTVRPCPSDASPSGTTCACNETSKQFDEASWTCLATLQCPSDATPNGATCVCNNQNMRYNEETKLCECTVVENTTKNGNECSCTELNKVIKDGKCQLSEEYLVRIKGDITTTFNKLTSTVGGFKKNVWKDAEGNFNTARLASDSIAGVVLGTAGGIITAKVVKKNQLKQGFEDVKCSIGGQSFASYGDDFTVGN